MHSNNLAVLLVEEAMIAHFKKSSYMTLFLTTNLFWHSVCGNTSPIPYFSFPHSVFTSGITNVMMTPYVLEKLVFLLKSLVCDCACSIISLLSGALSI